MTFFSGTDTATLKEEGRDRNNFVSLIVNNAGTYTAAITRRVNSKEVKESVSYEFFGEGEKHDTKEYINSADEIEWFYLKIEKEGEEKPFYQDMEDRLEEIRKEKAEKAKKNVLIQPYKGNSTTPVYATATPKETKPVQKSLFDNVEDDNLFSGIEIPYGTAKFNKEAIKQLVLQLITGSVILTNESKIDINKWAKTMPNMYQKRFGKGKAGMDLFKIWADTYVDFLTWYITDENLVSQGYDNTEICAICAHDMIEELDKLPENDYINGYIEVLEKYLVL